MPKPVHLQRRAGLQALRIFVPTVTWVVADGTRRALDYDSDVLAQLPWERLDAAALAQDWQPGALPEGAAGGRVVLDLRVLDDDFAPARQALEQGGAPLDPAGMVRALLDVAPNPWRVWGWVQAVLSRLLSRWDARSVGASGASLIEQLRQDLERERDRLAQEVFERLVRQGRIEFCLRADRHDYELPREMVLDVVGKPRKLRRASDDADMEKSLLTPALRTPDLNDFEVLFAGYLDEQPALRWWHRNVARTQYGLQGWKRHKVYPDFVFGLHPQGNVARVVLLETKGMHLEGNTDTRYKQALLERLTQAFADARFQSVGELALQEGGHSVVQCDLVFDAAWRAHMDGRYFPLNAKIQKK
ncbi:MAG: hypothetical protein K8F51_03095 [Comamonas sp.]|nr:hypothetical protein [Comamonas sp.]